MSKRSKSKRATDEGADRARNENDLKDTTSLAEGDQSERKGKQQAKQSRGGF